MNRTIVGVIVPAKWNSMETISAVSIQATDEVEYEVADGVHAKALLELLGRRIRASGPVELIQGRARIDVWDYEPAPAE